MHSPYATPSTTLKVLEDHGFNLKKSLGQNFLVNDAIIGKILDLADLSSGDVVLEIGPGIGTLTYALLDNSAGVVSVERDPSLPEVLAETLDAFEGKFALIEKDALDVYKRDVEAAVFDLGLSHLPNKLVSNLPYAVAATVVLDYFQRFDELKGMTVMVQREVAERMMATPGNKNYGAYTVKLSMYAAPAGSFVVGPNNFMPPPHVESTVLKLVRRTEPISPELAKAACTMADASFFARRKTISNSCKQFFSGRNPEVAGRISEILDAAKVDAKARGESIPPEKYLDLGEALLRVTNG